MLIIQRSLRDVKLDEYYAEFWRSLTPFIKLVSNDPFSVSQGCLWRISFIIRALHNFSASHFNKFQCRQALSQRARSSPFVSLLSSCEKTLCSINAAPLCETPELVGLFSYCVTSQNSRCCKQTLWSLFYSEANHCIVLLWCYQLRNRTRWFKKLDILKSLLISSNYKNLKYLIY